MNLMYSKLWTVTIQRRELLQVSLKHDILTEISQFKGEKKNSKEIISGI